MKTKLFILITGILYFIPSIRAQLNADSTFASYFTYAQTYADTYPREKAHLHFDNTSYFIGDTIWYKAYVTTAEQNRPSKLSKPLYVEILDQLGNIKEQQIVELQKGEGHGQFILTSAFLSGYYEIRAYTRWMVSFDEKQYFSRTFPVYTKRKNDMEEDRNIVTYHMDESMEKRPHEKETKKLVLRFYPEGGQLVRGIPSVLAFEAISRDNGPVDIQGVLCEEDGKETTRFCTLHNGMGAFTCTPGLHPAVAKVVYEGKDYSFTLPEALDSGYTINATGKEATINVQIFRSSLSLNDTLAVFVSHQGRPLSYQVIDFGDQLSKRFTIATESFPEGVLQLSLMTIKGATLCDRFCYIMAPDSKVQLQVSSPTSLFAPYEPIQYKVSMKDKDGQPLQGKFSIAIRSALKSDYSEYDNTIFTDLLLTSDLKGYIHQPGYYFADHSAARRTALDILLLVHGWRKYDMSHIIGVITSKIAIKPETDLVLHGQVRSFVRDNIYANMGVSIIARRDTLSIAGSTVTDSLGSFSIPMSAFEGTLDAVIQTRRKEKKRNRQTSILLDRNFSPDLRKFCYEELNPQWKDISSMKDWSNQADSLYMDSLIGPNKYVLDQVVVKANRLRFKKIKKFKRTVKAYYDIPREVDRLRDQGEAINYFPDLLMKLNPKLYSKPDNKSMQNGYLPIYYGMLQMEIIVNGNPMAPIYMDKSVDAIKSVMFCIGPKLDAEKGINFETGKHPYSTESVKENLDNVRESYFEEKALNASLSSYNGNVTTEADLSSVFYCYIITVDDWSPDKGYLSHGIRRTRIQGYSKPLEFYSPCYSDINKRSSDSRRTLYWNPDAETNEKGEAIIKCYNSDSSDFVTTSIEALYQGTAVAFNAHSAKY